MSFIRFHIDSITSNTELKQCLPGIGCNSNLLFVYCIATRPKRLNYELIQCELCKCRSLAFGDEGHFSFDMIVRFINGTSMRCTYALELLNEKKVS